MRADSLCAAVCIIFAPICCATRQHSAPRVGKAKETPPGVEYSRRLPHSGARAHGRGGHRMARTPLASRLQDALSEAADQGLTRGKLLRRAGVAGAALAGLGRLTPVAEGAAAPG